MRTRLFPPLLAALAWSLACAGFGASGPPDVAHPSTYEDEHVRFDHPGNWWAAALEPTDRSAHVEVEGDAMLVWVDAYKRPPDPEDLLIGHLAMMDWANENASYEDVQEVSCRPAPCERRTMQFVMWGTAMPAVIEARVVGKAGVTYWVTADDEALLRPGVDLIAATVTVP